MVSPAKMAWATNEPNRPARLHGLLGADNRRPDAVGIPAQKLSGESHRKREEQQDHAAHPVHLARVLVGGVKVDLGHVHDRNQNHRRCAEEMHSAQDAAERRLLGDVLEAFERLPARGDVGQGQADAGDHLHDEAAEGGASENVPPSCVGGDDVVHHRDDDL